MELAEAWDGLWAMQDCYWMSRPHNIRNAEWKLGQLKYAVDIGFDVPKTLLTTNAEDAHAFYEACNGNVIYKVLSEPSLASFRDSSAYSQESEYEQENTKLPYVEYYETKTTPIQKKHLSMLKSVELLPCLFQEYIPKKLELRVTIIGDDIFVGEIHSQAHKRTKIDWRYYDVNIPYRKGNLPITVAERCFALVRKYGLNFSTMDLILTPDDRFVFLENNPNGQFLFVEQKIPELKMSEALASCFIRGSNS
jgi:glutathione synthase/RimK-type ligase-like ATP-grasp enzyme